MLAVITAVIIKDKQVKVFTATEKTQNQSQVNISLTKSMLLKIPVNTVLNMSLLTVSFCKFEMFHTKCVTFIKINDTKFIHQGNTDANVFGGY